MQFTISALQPIERRIKSAGTVALKARAAEYKTGAAQREVELEERSRLQALKLRQSQQETRIAVLERQREQQRQREEARQAAVDKKRETLAKTMQNVSTNLTEKKEAYQQDKRRREYAAQYVAYLEECRRRQNMNARTQVRIEEEFRRQLVQKRQEQRVTQAHLTRFNYLVDLKEKERAALEETRKSEQKIVHERQAAERIRSAAQFPVK